MPFSSAASGFPPTANICLPIDGLGGDVIINENHKYQDYRSPGETLVSCEHPGDAGDYSRNKYQLQDEHIHRQDFKVVGLCLFAVINFTYDEQNNSY